MKTKATRLRTKAKRTKATPPVSRRLDLFAEVLVELEAVATNEQDPQRASKLRGIARRLGVALHVNRVVGLDFVAIKNKASAQAPRDGARSAMRDLVLHAMATGRRREQSFKDFLAGWEKNAIKGLRLKYEPAADKYMVTDENGGAGQKPYALASLAAMYSSKRRINANRR